MGLGRAEYCLFHNHPTNCSIAKGEAAYRRSDIFAKRLALAYIAANEVAAERDLRRRRSLQGLVVRLLPLDDARGCVLHPF